MVIFRIIHNLSTLIFRGLFGIFWLPITFLTRHLFLCIMLALCVIIYAQFKSGGGGHIATPPVPAASRARAAPGVPAAIDPVLRHEDGDSAFSTDLYGQMTPPERAAYSSNFFWAMSNLPDGQTHGWTSGNIAGSLRPDSSFENNSGARCRKFSEALKVHTIEQTLTGIACDNGGGTWCKLKPNATPACNLGGHAGGLFDSITGSLRNLF
jgi:surface antigen